MRNYYIFILLLGILVLALIIVGFMVGGTPVAQKTTQSSQYTNIPTLAPINPARQFAQENNTQRRSDVTVILNGISQYAADNNGALPPGSPAEGETKNITSTDTGSAFCNAFIPTYLAALPHDPAGGNYTDCSNYDTKYQIYVSAPIAGDKPRIRISAPLVELGTVISVSR